MFSSIRNRIRFSAFGSYLAELGIRSRAGLMSDGRPEVRFVIFCQGRSGSTLLSDLLGNHPDLYSDGEVFGAMMKHRIRSPYAYVTARASVLGSRGYGCKIKIYDLTSGLHMSVPEARDLMHRLRDDGWRIVHLKRNDLLRQALSSLVAESRQLYHFTGKERSAKGAVAVDAASLVWRMELLSTFTEQEKYVLEGVDHVRVDYERDLLEPAQHQRTLERILDFLGMDRVTATTKYERTSSDDPAETISNYDAVIERVKRSRFAHLLESHP